MGAIIGAVIVTSAVAVIGIFFFARKARKTQPADDTYGRQGSPSSEPKYVEPGIGEGDSEEYEAPSARLKYMEDYSNPGAPGFGSDTRDAEVPSGALGARTLGNY
jgi:hypothetical protein